MSARVLLSSLVAAAAVSGALVLPHTAVAGPEREAAIPICGGGWSYAAEVGVYVAWCYGPPGLSGADLTYDPGEQDASAGPCLTVSGGVDGSTDVCLDTDFWIGPWGPCKIVTDGGRGVYSSFCWDGRDATAPPSASVFFNGSGDPCLRIDRPGVEGHVDACATAL